MEKHEAFAILGIKEDASKSEIEKRYAVVLRKYRSGNIEGLSEDEFNKITEAYNLLMGYTVELPDDEKKHKIANPILKKLGIDEDKLGNFLHYYKIHIIVGIFVLAVAISMIRGCINKVEPDLSVVFMGTVYCFDLERFEEELKSLVPGVMEVSTDNIPISESQEKQDPQLQIAMLQKAVLAVAVGDVDLIILDEAQLEKFAKQGAFMKLDDIAAKMDLPKERLLINKVEEKDREGNINIVDEGVYGIILEKGRILTDSIVVGDEIIATISVKSKNYDKAVKLIEILIDNAKEE